MVLLMLFKVDTKLSLIFVLMKILEPYLSLEVTKLENIFTKLLLNTVRELKLTWELKTTLL